MSLSCFHYCILFAVGPGNAQTKKKKQEETDSVSQVSSQENDVITKKFTKKTKIPQTPTPQSKNHGSQSQQPSTSGTSVKRGRKPKAPQNPKFLKKKPDNAFVIEDKFKSGFQSDARSLRSPKDTLVNYRLIVSDKKSITFINNEYYFNDELQKVPTIFFTSVYYEKVENLADPENDDGRREMHVKFSPKEYPLIMKALREIKAKNHDIFKSIPDDAHELQTIQYEEEDEEEDDYYYEEAEEAEEDDAEVVE